VLGTSPAWAPDGQRLAFSSGEFRLSGALLVARGDGTGVRRIATSCGRGAPSATCGGALDSPAWAPDGRRLAFVNLIGGRDCPPSDLFGCAPGPPGDPGSALEVVNRDGADRHALFTSPNPSGTLGRPAWSPDGGLIVYAQPASRGGCVGSGLWTIRPDGTHHQPLIRTCRPGLRKASSPDWSPDGRYVAFAAETQTVYWSCSLHPSGGPLGLPSQPEDCHRVTAPPNGLGIGSSVLPDTVVDIYVVDRQGRHLRRITRNQPRPIGCVLVPLRCPNGRHDAQSPSWSPSGKFIAYADAGIWTVRASGGQQHRIGPARRFADHPAWQPRRHGP
jgi:Tol biopolymer transport system component